VPNPMKETRSKGGGTRREKKFCPSKRDLSCAKEREIIDPERGGEPQTRAEMRGQIFFILSLKGGGWSSPLQHETGEGRECSRRSSNFGVRRGGEGSQNRLYVSAGKTNVLFSNSRELYSYATKGRSSQKKKNGRREKIPGWQVTLRFAG